MLHFESPHQAEQAVRELQLIEDLMLQLEQTMKFEPEQTQSVGLSILDQLSYAYSRYREPALKTAAASLAVVTLSAVFPERVAEDRAVALQDVAVLPLEQSEPVVFHGPTVAPKIHKETSEACNEDQHQVQPGDTMAKVAEAYGRKLNTLVSLNNREDPNLIEVGECLRVESTSALLSSPVRSPFTLSEAGDQAPLSVALSALTGGSIEAGDLDFAISVASIASNPKDAKHILVPGFDSTTVSVANEISQAIKSNVAPIDLSFADGTKVSINEGKLTPQAPEHVPKPNDSLTVAPDKPHKPEIPQEPVVVPPVHPDTQPQPAPQQESAPLTETQVEELLMSMLSPEYHAVMQQKPTLEYALKHYDTYKKDSYQAGPKINDLDWAKLAYAAGWRGEDLVITVSLAAGAEASGYPFIINSSEDKSGQQKIYAVGGMQMLVHPNFEGLEPGGVRNPHDNLDPLTNLKNARILHGYQGWERGWQAYRHGKHAKFMERAQSAVAQLEAELDTLAGIAKPQSPTPTEATPEVPATAPLAPQTPETYIIGDGSSEQSSPRELLEQEVRKLHTELESLRNSETKDSTRLIHLVRHSPLFDHRVEMPGDKHVIRYLPPAELLQLQYEFSPNTPSKERYATTETVALAIYTAYTYQHNEYRMQHYPNSWIRVNDLSAKQGHKTHDGNEIDLTSSMQGNPANNLPSSNGPIFAFNNHSGVLSGQVTKDYYDPKLEKQILDEMTALQIGGTPLIDTRKSFYNRSLISQNLGNGPDGQPKTVEALQAPLKTLTNHSDHIHIATNPDVDDIALKNAANGGGDASAKSDLDRIIGNLTE